MLDNKKTKPKRITNLLTNQVYFLRISKGLTQKQFAEKLDEVETDTISKIEQRKIGLSLDIAYKISKTFNVPIGKLFDDDEEETIADSILNKFNDLFDISLRISPKNNIKTFLTLSFNEKIFKLLFETEYAKMFLEEEENQLKIPTKDIYTALIEKYKKDFNEYMKNITAEEFENKKTKFVILSEHEFEKILHAKRSEKQ